MGICVLCCCEWAIAAGAIANTIVAVAVIAFFIESLLMPLRYSLCLLVQGFALIVRFWLQGMVTWKFR